MLYEAPHGTAHDLYLRYLESDGKEVIFNPSALLYALANALFTLGERESNEALMNYGNELKTSLIQVVANGTITGDIKGKTTDPAGEKVVDLNEFLAAVEAQLDA